MVDNCSFGRRRNLFNAWYRRKPLPRHDHRVFTLGVCAMKSKVMSSPMRSILKRLDKTGDFHIVEFDEDLILNTDYREWPLVDCLITFYSRGYPLDKVREYVNSTKPIILNDLDGMATLRSRIKVYQLLEKCCIPNPSHIVVDHCNLNGNTFEEYYDYIVYNGLQLNKPFIEKPENADDHNNYVYYPRNAGGGCKKLFRKIKDRSSAFYPDLHQVRRDGAYIYEEFLTTFGTDVKVYTVGQLFAHAEARKAPTLDGKVLRTEQGKEVRYAVMLNEFEKYMAYRIVETFKQTVCGFDILRTTTGRSYVCDINGWSFVKGNIKYYNDCAYILRMHFLQKLQGKYNFVPRELPCDWLAPDLEEEGEQHRRTFGETGDQDSAEDSDEELRTVVVVMRHGDRKPKQKLKFVTSEPLILAYHNENPSVDVRKEVKLKSPEELQGLLEKVRAILKHLEFASAQYEKFKLLQQVLERGDSFTGINRKFQIKPLAWRETTAADGEKKTVVVESIVVAKWGGELTKVGRAQAEDLGKYLRIALYPGDDESGLLRLHSTFRHDLKIYTSDEGRCQVTSAAFTKGFLDLEGELTPILVQMVVRNAKAHALLDACRSHTNARDQCKAFIDALVNETPCSLDAAVVSEMQTALSERLRTSDQADLANSIENIKATLLKVFELIREYIDALNDYAAQFKDCDSPMTRFNENEGGFQDLSPLKETTNNSREASSSNDGPANEEGYTRCLWRSSIHGDDPCRAIESKQSLEDQFTSDARYNCHSCFLVNSLRDRLREIVHRWRELNSAWFDPETEHFDSSKIPDIIDNVRYDLIHNHTSIGTLGLQKVFQIYKHLKPIGTIVASLEYGVTARQRVEIGTKHVSRLLKKILRDITFSRPGTSTMSTVSLKTQWRKSSMSSATPVTPAAKGVSDFAKHTQTGSLPKARPRDTNVSVSAERGQASNFLHPKAPASSLHAVPLHPSGSSTSPRNEKHMRDFESTSSHAASLKQAHSGGDLQAGLGLDGVAPRLLPAHRQKSFKGILSPLSKPGAPLVDVQTTGSVSDTDALQLHPALASVKAVVINSDQLWGHQNPSGTLTSTKLMRSRQLPDRHACAPGGIPNVANSDVEDLLDVPSHQELPEKEPDSSTLQKSESKQNIVEKCMSGSSSLENIAYPGKASLTPSGNSLFSLLSKNILQQHNLAYKSQNSGPLENKETSNAAGEPDDDDYDDDTISHFRLNEEEAKQMGIKSPWRIVRSRYYVASASHIVSLYNILTMSSAFLKHESHADSTLNGNNLADSRWLSSNSDETFVSTPSIPMLVDDIEPSFSHLESENVHYLSHIVFRVWERKKLHPTDPNRLRLEILFSPGAKDGFGSNFKLLKKHTQQEQILFNKHLDHWLYVHRYQIQCSASPDLKQAFLRTLSCPIGKSLTPVDGLRRCVSWSVTDYLHPDYQCNNMKIFSIEGGLSPRTDDCRQDWPKHSSAYSRFSSFHSDCVEINDAIIQQEITPTFLREGQQEIRTPCFLYKTNSSNLPIPAGFEYKRLLDPKYTSTALDPEGIASQQLIPPYCELTPPIRLAKHTSVSDFELIVSSLFHEFDMGS